MVQWLALHTRSAGRPVLVPGLGTRSHVPQLRTNTAKKKETHAASVKQPPTTPPKKPILASCPHFVQVSRSMMTGIVVNVHDESLSPDLGLLKDTSTVIAFRSPLPPNSAPTITSFPPPSLNLCGLKDNWML